MIHSQFCRTDVKVNYQFGLEQFVACKDFEERPLPPPLKKEQD